MKVYSVKAAKKEYICHKCGKTIKVGQSYLWWKPIEAERKRWHAEHGVPPRSETVSSRQKRTVYEAQEALLEYMDQIRYSDKAFIINKRLWNFGGFAAEYLGIAEEIADEYSASADNVEKRFGEVPIVVYCRERHEAIYEWVDKIRSLIPLLKNDIRGGEFDLKYLEKIVENAIDEIRDLEL